MILAVSSPKDLAPLAALQRLRQILAEEKEKVLSEETQSALERDFLVIQSKLTGLHSGGAYSEEADEWTLHLQRVVQSLYQQYENASDSPLFYFGQLAAAFTQARQGSLRLLPERAVRAAFRSKRALQILKILSKKGPQTVGDLARSLGVRQNNLSPILDPLEEAGVVRKEQFGRTKRIYLLPIGTGILARIGPIEIMGEPEQLTKARRQPLYYHLVEGTADEQLEQLDLNELVDEAIALNEPEWRDHGAKVSLEVQQVPIPPVMGNRAAIREALTKFLINAVDSMPKGVRIIVKTLLARDVPLVEVAVVDKGVDFMIRRGLFTTLLSAESKEGEEEPSVVDLEEFVGKV